MHFNGDGVKTSTAALLLDARHIDVMIFTTNICCNMLDEPMLQHQQVFITAAICDCHYGHEDNVDIYESLLYQDHTTTSTGACR